VRGGVFAQVRVIPLGDCARVLVTARFYGRERVGRRAPTGAGDAYVQAEEVQVLGFARVRHDIRRRARVFTAQETRLGIRFVGRAVFVASRVEGSREIEPSTRARMPFGGR
jgi:hypothetical protein